jgi:hypothetical protein
VGERGVGARERERESVCERERSGERLCRHVQVQHNGLKYTWDVTRVMFSRGNVNERRRMGQVRRLCLQTDTDTHMRQVFTQKLA